MALKKKKKKRGREKETEKHFLLARLLLSVSRGCFLDRQLLCLFFLTNSTMVSFSFFHISVFIFFSFLSSVLNVAYSFWLVWIFAT